MPIPLLLMTDSWSTRCPTLAMTPLTSQQGQQAERLQEPDNRKYTKSTQSNHHHSRAYHSCLGWVQSCLWRCLSTSWYHSSERRVRLSGTKSSLHSMTFKTIWLTDCACLQNVHRPRSQPSSIPTPSYGCPLPLPLKYKYTHIEPATHTTHFIAEPEQPHIRDRMKGKKTITFKLSIEFFCPESNFF